MKSIPKSDLYQVVKTSLISLSTDDLYELHDIIATVIEYRSHYGRP